MPRKHKRRDPETGKPVTTNPTANYNPTNDPRVEQQARDMLAGITVQLQPATLHPNTTMSSFVMHPEAQVRPMNLGPATVQRSGTSRISNAAKVRYTLQQWIDNTANFPYLKLAFDNAGLRLPVVLTDNSPNNPDSIMTLQLYVDDPALPAGGSIGRVAIVGDQWTLKDGHPQYAKQVFTALRSINEYRVRTSEVDAVVEDAQARIDYLADDKRANS